jgi:hypothetical protein
VYQRGHYCLFKYKDLERYATAIVGSKRAWLEQLGPRALRRKKLMRAKRMALDAYNALLATFSPHFQQFVNEFGDGSTCMTTLKDRAAQYEAVEKALRIHHLDLPPHIASAKWFILHGSTQDSATRVADSIAKDVEEKARLNRVRQESCEILGFHPKQFVNYLGYGSNHLGGVGHPHSLPTVLRANNGPGSPGPPASLRQLQLC